ncbi:ABC transporter ATP-binding protein [Anaerocolumna sp. MB42-C2]|uniref:ABC transporter ATP-binding protein n=1 Tax=Anaerocolumna sp. MB42-C2 TaxID=3070997 RepID=UPI0027E0F49E|nr:ABC transporter ATP-binding protein [Anaerocolumna sp. MB42-C2]WMJ86448.1 ABC transporter ATP-binding protein [Anaerocolumna sp. MB42-C2]
MKHLNKKNGVIRNNLFILKIIFSTTPVYAISFILFGVISGCIQFINSVYFIRTITNQVQAKESLNKIVTTLIIFALMNVAYLILSNVCNFLMTPLAKIKLEKHVQVTLLHKAVSIGVSAFDDPNFYDGYILSMTSMDKKIYAVLETLSNLLKSIVTTVLTINLIFIIDPFCFILVIASMVISVFGGKKLNALLFKRKNEMLVYDRKMDYTDRLFYLSDYAKEIRMNDISGMLIDDYKKAVDDIRGIISKYSTPIVIFSHLEDMSTLFFDVLYVTSLVLRLVLKGLISVGDFVSMINSAWTLSNNVREIARLVNEFNDYSIYIDKFRTFSSITDENSGDKLLTENTGMLSFNNVWFHYPNETKDVLQGITLAIKPHEKIALVGYNGSGKSTLIKLLLRLYNPQRGVVEANGLNVTEYSLQSYRAEFGVVSQDFNMYEVSLAENVAMGELTRSQYGLVRDTISTVRLFPETEQEDLLSRRIGKEFDENGYILSGGERQKVALARVIYSSRDCIVLDEPSAALDPESEYYFNKLISEKLSDKTIIIISHRLSTTRMMDKVFMMESGQIIESGTHKVLMNLNGKYAEMYRVQAQRYGVSE